MRANKNRPAGSAATVMSDVTTPPSATGAVQVVPSYLRQSTAAPVVRVKTETVPDGDAIAAPTGANTAALGAPPPTGERPGRTPVHAVVDRAAELRVAVGAGRARRAIGDVRVGRARGGRELATGDSDRGPDHGRADEEAPATRARLEEARR